MIRCPRIDVYVTIVFTIQIHSECDMNVYIVFQTSGSEACTMGVMAARTHVMNKERKKEDFNFGHVFSRLVVYASEEVC